MSISYQALYRGISQFKSKNWNLKPSFFWKILKKIPFLAVIFRPLMINDFFLYVKTLKLNCENQKMKKNVL